MEMATDLVNHTGERLAVAVGGALEATQFQQLGRTLGLVTDFVLGADVHPKADSGELGVRVLLACNAETIAKGAVRRGGDLGDRITHGSGSCCVGQRARTLDDGREADRHFQ